MARHITEREWRKVQCKRAIGDACVYALIAVVTLGALAFILRYSR